jgi:hypothetical protein
MRIIDFPEICRGYVSSVNTQIEMAEFVSGVPIHNLKPDPIGTTEDWVAQIRIAFYSTVVRELTSEHGPAGSRMKNRLFAV